MEGNRLVTKLNRKYLSNHLVLTTEIWCPELKKSKLIDQVEKPHFQCETIENSFEKDTSAEIQFETFRAIRAYNH